MSKCNFTIAILLSLLCCCFIIPIHSALAQSPNITIQLQGRIIYDGYYGLTLKYYTDFEDVTKVDAHHLSILIPHNFRFEGEGGARMWMETGLAHSGNKCVGMELTDITSSRRCEFNLQNMIDLVGNEVFVSVWLYLPSEWALHAPGWNWYAIAAPFFDYNPPDYTPYLEIHINQPNPAIEQFDVEVCGRDQNFVRYSLDTYENFPLPRGKWFNLQWYVYRHETNGKIKVWFNGQLISDRSGLTTKFTDDYLTTIAKIYHSTSDTTIHRIWVDDLEIYGLP